MKTWLLFGIFSLTAHALSGQHSVAREWNELVLDAIRNDFARPTVHARNLFHTSIAMYDAWALYDERAEPYLVGNQVGEYACTFDGIQIPRDETERKQAREEAMSYAVARIVLERFKNSPGSDEIARNVIHLMTERGYTLTNTSTDYGDGSPAALGNYIAACILDYGLQDGANEQNDYENLYYQEVNDPLVVALPGNPDISDPNRWQPLTLDIFIDQSGNVIPFNTPGFLGPEWGRVQPFSLTPDQATDYMRDGDLYRVYFDPGRPPEISYDGEEYLADEYKWGFALVAVWSSQLDPEDGVMWDISPGSIGNNAELPASFPEYRGFYNLIEGGDPGKGWTVNPVTGEPYEPQIVPRGDYARVLAEFWADGPDSETPPGHWFTILNKVMDHPQFVRKYRGQGQELDSLEYDVKAYFTLGGAMHDAAVTAWGIKGWYDYIRPVSAIRYMADQGQSSDSMDVSYHPNGIPLIDGYIEIVRDGDPLAQSDPSAVGKIKLYAWRGPDYITNPEEDVAGVGWILAENWWPYQRPSFVTPNFAGYISGHSTYSRAAAEVMTFLTGDEFFPGGIGQFDAPRNEFLVFEDGPSVDLQLQWATYRDASDQTSLSRLWGGIHPPADDIPGRLIGIQIGLQAFEKARSYFNTSTTSTEDFAPGLQEMALYPNPLRPGETLNIVRRSEHFAFDTFQVYNLHGQLVRSDVYPSSEGDRHITLNTDGLDPGAYFLRVSGNRGAVTYKLILME